MAEHCTGTAAAVADRCPPRHGGTGLQPALAPGRGRCSATRGWSRTGWASSPSRRLFWTPTTDAAQSAARIPLALQAVHIRPVAKGGSAGSTPGCCSSQTSTPCSTAGTRHRPAAPPARQPPPSGGLQQRRPVLRRARAGHRPTGRPGRPARARVPGMAPRRGLPQDSRKLIEQRPVTRSTCGRGP